MIPSVNLLCFTCSLPPPPITNPNPNFPSPPRRQFVCPCRRTGWDSNAESVRVGRFSYGDQDSGGSGGGRKWWSDEPADDFDDEFEGFDDDDDDDEEGFWDKIWIFKVFKSYGYMLPAIIASMLLATGPKAFLMALALPLGQSAISLAIDKLWGRASEGPRTKARSKRKPFTQYSSSRYKEKERRDNGYRSWVSPDTKVADEASGSRRSSFGGWDELEDEGEYTRRKSPSSDGSARADPVKKGKLSKSGRYGDAPLFLRLLIAVFPFLGSWTRIL